MALEHIAAETRIRSIYLEAIENDRLEAIPGGFFSRSFVRQYASYLKMDSEQVELALEAMTPRPVDTVRVDKILTDYRPANGPVFGMAAEGEESEFTTDSSYLKDPKTGMPWIALAVVLIVASFAVLTWQRRPDFFSFGGVPPSSTPATKRAASKPVLVPAPTPATTPGRSEPVPAPAAIAAPAGDAVPPAAALVGFRVSASAQSWVEVKIDGDRVYADLLAAGQSRNWEARESAEVRTGNAGALTVELNGANIGPIGPSGMVRTVLLSAAGAEISATLKIPSRSNRASGAVPARAQ